MLAEGGFQTHIEVQLNNSGFDSKQIEKFFEYFKDISHKQTVVNLMGWSNIEFKDWSLSQKTGLKNNNAKIRERSLCSSPFKSLAINSNGSVSMCCVDWSHSTLIGDLKKFRLVDLWNSDLMRSRRLNHIDNDFKGLEVCRNCDYVQSHNDSIELAKYRSELRGVIRQGSSDVNAS